MTMTMTEMKKEIVRSFKRQYGFAPTMASIRPLETSGYGKKYEFMAFHIGGIGYTFSTLWGMVEKNEHYDMF